MSKRFSPEEQRKVIESLPSGKQEKARDLLNEEVRAGKLSEQAWKRIKPKSRGLAKKLAPLFEDPKPEPKPEEE